MQIVATTPDTGQGIRLSLTRVERRELCARRGWHHWAGPGNDSRIPRGTKACRVCNVWVAE